MKFTDNTKWKWYAEKHLSTMTVRMYQVGQCVDGKTKSRRFTEVEELVHDEGTYIVPEEATTLSLDYDEAQDVIQELWNLGFRPTGIESSNAYVQSLKDHIETLQKTNKHFMELQKSEIIDPMALAQIASKSIQKASDS